jgi:hypothetical protein
MTEQVSMAGVSDRAWKIEGLAANGPYPELREKLELFGQFVGDWEMEDRYLKEDGTWDVGRGRIHWRWILEGRGMQDTFTEIDEKSGREIPWGTTVRFYDPKIDAWRSTWNSPRQGAVKSFIGRKVADQIVLERRSEEGHTWKWIFSEIKKDSFRWHSEMGRDNGKTWTLTEEMQVRRKPQTVDTRLAGESYIPE